MQKMRSPTALLQRRSTRWHCCRWHRVLSAHSPLEPRRPSRLRLAPSCCCQSNRAWPAPTQVFRIRPVGRRVCRARLPVMSRACRPSRSAVRRPRRLSPAWSLRPARARAAFRPVREDRPEARPRSAVPQRNGPRARPRPGVRPRLRTGSSDPLSEMVRRVRQIARATRPPPRCGGNNGVRPRGCRREGLSPPTQGGRQPLAPRRPPKRSHRILPQQGSPPAPPCGLGRPREAGVRRMAGAMRRASTAPSRRHPSHAPDRDRPPGLHRPSPGRRQRSDIPSPGYSRRGQRRHERW